MFRNFSLVGSRQISRYSQQQSSKFSIPRPFTRQQRNSGNASYTGERFQKEENAKEREFINREDSALLKKFRQQHQGKEQAGGNKDAANQAGARKTDEQTTQKTSSNPSSGGSRAGYGNVQYDRHVGNKPENH